MNSIPQDPLTATRERIILRPLPDIVDWYADPGACTITLMLSPDSLTAWMCALDADVTLYRQPARQPEAID